MKFPPYESLRRETEVEITIKRSVFRASIAPCTTKDEAQEFLDTVRAKYWDAVHHCYAWRLGPHGLEYRMSDDGEPSGTAGKPILFALQRANVSDAIVVVTRYFGGVKLGVGPLARAYAEVTAMALEQAERWLVRQIVHVRVFCSYDDVSTVTRIFEAADARYTPTYSDAITFEVDVAEEAAEAMLEEIVDKTQARAGYLKVPAERE